MANVISISLTSDDLKNLQMLKVRDDIGASSVMRVGIQHLINKPRIQAEQEELKMKNEKLFKITQILQKRIAELEVQNVGIN